MRTTRTKLIATGAAIAGIAGGTAAGAIAATGDTPAKSPKMTTDHPRSADDNSTNNRPMMRGRRGPGGPGGHHGHHGPPREALAQIAKALGISESKLREAMEATRPARPDGDRDGRRAEFAAAIAKELGVEASAVEKILEAGRPDRGERPDPGQRPQPGTPPAGLVKALADGLDVDEEKVKAALETAFEGHRDDHDQREQKMYDALAQKLGLDAAKVKQAFEAARPNGPRRP